MQVSNTAAGAGLGFSLDAAQVGATGVNGTADIALGDVVAGTDGGGVRQGVGPQGRGTALGTWRTL